MTMPLMCVLSLANSLVGDAELAAFPKRIQDIRMILNTTNLLLSQVKLLLDKHSLENNTFQPNYEYVQMNSLIEETKNIMNEQAKLRGIELSCIKSS